MNVQATLLRAVIEEPWDDTHRLVFADTLEEAGQVERAQFIRTQIARAQLSASDPRAVELERQEKRLLKGRLLAWKTELPRLKGVTWGGFTRGFVGTVDFLTAYRFRQHIRTVVASAPVERVDIQRAESLTAVSKSPHLSRVLELNLDGARQAQGMDRQSVFVELATATSLGRLVSLGLSWNNLDAVELRALLKSSAFPRLQLLNLRGNGFQDDTIPIFLASSLIAQVPVVLLLDNRFTDAGKQQLREALGDRVIL
jgi:uncharacterized protein (TIGR02996 family)